jgi:hypothetical protein
VREVHFYFLCGAICTKAIGTDSFLCLQITEKEIVREKLLNYWTIESTSSLKLSQGLDLLSPEPEALSLGGSCFKADPDFDNAGDGNKD